MPKTELVSRQIYFLDVYLSCFDVVFSAYEAGYLNNLKDRIKYKNLSKKQLTRLRETGNKLLNDDRSRKYLADSLEEKKKENDIADIDEVLTLLTIIMRRCKNTTDTYTARESIKAMELFVKHFPEWNNETLRVEEQICFSRGTE
jgi:phage terminase small subunit